ncbi:MAG: hypothetical protein WC942_12065, partial [Clostridia bacterium]
KRGLTNPTFRKRKKGSKDREIVDQAKQDQLQDIVQNQITWQEKFEMVKGAVKALATEKINSVIIYGSPGSGKTEEVTKTFKDLGVEYKSFSGGFKNADEVMHVIQKYRDGYILLFDDCDSVLKDALLKNLFKKILENTPERRIAYRDKEILFTSGCVFLSNLQTFDPALISRSLTIKIDLTNEQMLGKIKDTLENFHKEIDIKIKLKAWHFLQKWSSGVKSIDYRELEKVLIAMELQPQNWEKFSMLMLASQ